jgi:transcriptional regulator with XRE-family HTH domain
VSTDLAVAPRLRARAGTVHGVEEFDVPGALRRIRRLADTSQRELASACGVSQSAVAQAESGRRDLPVGTLARAAGLAGLRLVLLDAAGREICGMAPDTVRDRGRRRFPAHLDTHPTEERPALYAHRYDRPVPAYTVDRDRTARDRLRRRTGTPEDHHPDRPGDSPAERAEARRLAARRARDEERRKRRLVAPWRPIDDGFTCTCPPICDEVDDGNGRPVHAPDCACGCDLA